MACMLPARYLHAHLRKPHQVCMLHICGAYDLHFSTRSAAQLRCDLQLHASNTFVCAVHGSAGSYELCNRRAFTL
jgi:hypothetical protein